MATTNTSILKARSSGGVVSARQQKSRDEQSSGLETNPRLPATRFASGLLATCLAIALPQTLGSAFKTPLALKRAQIRMTLTGVG